MNHRTMRRISAAAASIVWTATLAAGGRSPETSVAAIRADIQFLADDLLEGRAGGSQGFEIAARYVASQFAAAGLEPAGDAGTWFQEVALLEGARISAAATLELERAGSRQAFKPLDDFVPGIDFVREEGAVAGEMVFVGHGITAPELAYDDFRNIDARGKVAVILSGAPPRFPSTQRAFFGPLALKSENLVRHGVIGVISIATPTDARRVPWERQVQRSWLPGVRRVDGSGVPIEAYPELRGSAAVSDRVGRILFEGVPRTLDEAFAAAERSEPQAFALPGRVSLFRRSQHRRFESRNVVARLPGSDPALRDQAVVFTAHLDHLGKGTAVGGDSIYNGAMDNASGVAVLLEVARALASLPVRPRRSILFVALTSEEQGLLGADYFAAHPPVPARQLVANINLDMPIAAFPLANLVAYGSEHSGLGTVARRAAEAEGMGLASDPWPEEASFVRSDQFQFVRRGIPALYISSGTAAGTPEVDGPKIIAQFLRDRYHQPSDDLSQPIHYPSLATLARVNVRIARDIGDEPIPPRWNAGDFFGTRFDRERAAQ